MSQRQYPIDPQTPWKAIRAQVNQEALDLIKQDCNLESLLGFVQRVPWHVFSLRKERRRSNVEGRDCRRGRPSAYVIFGMFTHGGVNGLTRVTREYPAVAKCLALVVKHSCPNQAVTSLCITCNTTSHPHRDIFNLQGVSNAIIPVIQPSKGGELWIAGPAQDHALRRVVKFCNDQPKVGYLYPIDQAFSFDPKVWHATQAWTGDRMVLVGYSLQGVTKLSDRDRQHLQHIGFPLPSSPQKTTEIRLKRFPSKAKTCCYSKELLEHADLPEHQGGHAADTPGDGGDASELLDQVAAQDPHRGVEGGTTRHHDREGRGEGDQQVPHQGGRAGLDGPAPDSVPQACQQRSVESNAPQVLHGELGSPRQGGLYGVRQARKFAVQRGHCASPFVRGVDAPDSSGQSRLSLEVEEVRDLGPEPHHDGEAADDRHAHQQHAKPPDSGRLRLQAAEAHSDQWGEFERGPRLTVGGADSGREDVPELLHRTGGPHLRAGIRAQDLKGVDQGVGQGQGAPLRDDPQATTPAGVVSPDSGTAGIPDESEDNWPPGEVCPLPFRVAKKISVEYEQAMVNTLDQLCGSRPVLLEVGCSEESLLVRLFGCSVGMVEIWTLWWGEIMFVGWLGSLSLWLFGLIRTVVLILLSSE